MAHKRGLLHAALILLAGALVAGILTMHVPLMSVLGAHGSLHAASASVHSASSTAEHGSMAGTAPAAVAPAMLVRSADGTPFERASEQLCHADGAGHGAPTSAHAVACDLSAPPVNAATALGAAALVAVVVMALVMLPSGGAAGGWLLRRGPPQGLLLRLSLCVIRV
ncbi:hypothetical protein [Quadrisphaera setariae]|uniref:Uncharacterized protein n=1 Tax=Quadrisphaera setariae TaxID=2593304 RepID=A0A5C8Z652_9ACTN|nr:hypothetical protein [Quadrisphaera setariae]TXR52410.1 hypothetical protein FMM08_19600 [Quadrisphaera setariae]